MTDSKTFRAFAPEEFNDAQLVGLFEPDSEEWHEARKSGIGGSDIGTVLGLNPWDSAFALWARRTGQISEKQLNSWAVRFGKAFEEPILQMWKQEHPEWDVMTTGTYRSRRHPFQLANPDALAQHMETGEWMILEVKTSRNPWKDVPPMYVAQVQHYMDVMGISKAVMVGVVGWSWEERVIDADPFYQEAMRAQASRFWDHLVKIAPPAWDGSKSTYEAVRELHPDIDDEKVDLGMLGEELVQAQQHLDAAEEEFTRLKSEVLEAMGRAKTGTVVRDGEEVRVASRQARGKGTPWLVVHR
jgi:putative phage-type endonuclease